VRRGGSPRSVPSGFSNCPKRWRCHLRFPSKAGCRSPVTRAPLPGRPHVCLSHFSILARSSRSGPFSGTGRLRIRQFPSLTAVGGSRRGRVGCPPRHDREVVRPRCLERRDAPVSAIVERDRLDPQGHRSANQRGRVAFRVRETILYAGSSVAATWRRRGARIMKSSP